MRLVGLLLGLVFGAALWLSGMADYDVIHRGLLFQEAHLYLMMVASIGTAAPLLWLLERRRWRTPFGGPLRIGREQPQAKHVKGGLTFGVGWAVAGTCPGAVAAMVAGGRLNGLWVMLGIGVGVLVRDGMERASTPPPASTTLHPTTDHGHRTPSTT
ncbi:DUF6691 family protein [Egicoccus sp. AB-alg2]|uniref:DUF6691 family protein n=1 Tax=Egicoccus sp. AB-alg2 TaxID=3242693 RepID=UPI00359EF4B2